MYKTDYYLKYIKYTTLNALSEINRLRHMNALL